MISAMMPMFQQMKGGGKGGDWGYKGGGRAHFKILDKNRDATVWLGGIPEGVTYQEVQENFKQAGNCKKVVFTSKANSEKSGTGFAWFETADEAKEAIKMFNGSEINGNKLEVD